MSVYRLCQNGSLSTMRSDLIRLQNHRMTRNTIIRFAHAIDPGLTTESIESKSINAEEINKFNAMAKSWWDPFGPCMPLHQFNPTRVRYIRKAILEHNPACLSTGPRALEGVQVLDVGCGGGILSENLARLGATVTGIDAAMENISVAKLHSKGDPSLAKLLTYKHITAEDVQASGQTFDVVVASEIIEHVDDPQEFVKTCSAMVKPKGVFIASTINQTWQAYVQTVVLAEHVLRWVPVGTHIYSKFITPFDMTAYLGHAGLSVVDTQGMSYDPALKWRLTDDTSINYITAAVKPDSGDAGAPQSAL